jgi:cysteine synthase A
LKSAYTDLIGNTPLIQLQSLSKLLNRNIYVKMESMNPGGTGKDRAVKKLLSDVIQNPNYKPGCIIVEGSSGSTGISLALQCKPLDLKLHIVMPDDQSSEKKTLLEKLGAEVTIVPCCAISNERHYVNQARKLANDLNGIFINQFDNISNYKSHYMETGPELWHQTNGNMDAFVMSAGTGGTIAGISR